MIVRVCNMYIINPIVIVTSVCNEFIILNTENLFLYFNYEIKFIGFTLQSFAIQQKMKVIECFSWKSECI